MNSVYINKIVKARKEYCDECAEHLEFGLIKRVKGKRTIDLEYAKEHDISPEDILILKKACDNGFRIMPGELHKYQTGRYDGNLYAIRLSIAVSAILTKYELWYED